MSYGRKKHAATPGKGRGGDVAKPLKTAYLAIAAAVRRRRDSGEAAEEIGPRAAPAALVKGVPDVRAQRDRLVRLVGGRTLGP